jgi:hypothetical protein
MTVKNKKINFTRFIFELFEKRKIMGAGGSTKLAGHDTKSINSYVFSTCFFSFFFLTILTITQFASCKKILAML